MGREQRPVAGRLWAAAGLLWAALAGVGQATDHIDGSLAVNAPRADLTDLYAFTAGPMQARLVVILDIITAAQPWERPAPDTAFEVVIAGAETDPAVGPALVASGPRHVLGCHFEQAAASCSVTVAGAVGAQLTVPLGTAAEVPGLRVFVGKRSDPFVLNGVWAAELAAKDQIPAPSSWNIIQGLNVFSIIAEIDRASLLGQLDGQVLALGAQARDLATGQIFDRVGRPEIANIALQSNTGPDLRDDLNRAPALDLPPSLHAAMMARLRANLDRYDAMDPAPFAVNKDALAAILAEDLLAIDPALPCEGAGYFDLEYALLRDVTPDRCGGRPVSEDVIDTVYGLLIRGDPGQRVSDGASTPTRPATDAFPYLAKPNAGPEGVYFALRGRMLGALSAPGQARNLALVAIAAALLALIALVWAAVRSILRRRSRA